MAELTFNSAMRLLAQKNYQAVYDRAISALLENEKNPLAFFFLGMVASDNGHPVKALEFFAKASEHGPKTARYHAYYAKSLITLGRHAEAKEQAGTAARLKTNDAFVADIIGTVYSRSGAHQLAIPLFRTATKLNPNWSIFQFNLGASAQFIGDIKIAKKAYARAVAIDPKFYRAWFALVSLEKQTLEDNHIETLESLFDGAGQDADARLLLGHAVAKTLEDLNQYPESLEWLHKAKRLQKTHIRYDKQSAAQVFEAAKSVSLISSTSQKPKPDITPIFIVGMPRTGTTLVARILSSHTDVTSAGELDVFSGLVRDKSGTSERLDVQTFLSAQDRNLEDIGQTYRQKIRALSERRGPLIDKTPLNFLYAGLIHQALPDAKIICLRRGAMDSCLSNYRQLFALQDKRYHYTFDLTDTAAFYSEFDALMAHWRAVLPDDRFTEVRYEDIVHDQERQTRRLLEFCDLGWDAACLDFHENAAPVDTASSVQVRQPLYSGAIDRWKKYGAGLDNLKAALGKLADT